MGEGAGGRPGTRAGAAAARPTTGDVAGATGPATSAGPRALSRLMEDEAQETVHHLVVAVPERAFKR